MGVSALAIGSAGCGSDESSAAQGGTGGQDAGGGPTTVTLHPDAPPLPGETECKVVVTMGIAVPNVEHVPACTHVEYPTNPPSGGDHWPVWAAYKAYQTPVPREMYVHDQEHGGVVLAYRCADACPEVVSALEAVRTGVATDPLCAIAGLQARVILTPDPELDHPIAAASWGATYVATCIDPPSLSTFVDQVYGKGTEATCAQGRDIEDPASGAPNCGGAGGGGGSGGMGGAGGVGGGM